MKRIIIAAAILMAAFVSAQGQSRSETRLYEKTLKKATVKAYDKFFKKYPESVYLPELIRLRDTTGITPAQAEEIAVSCGVQPVAAVAYREAWQDHIVALSVEAAGISSFSIEKDGNGWKVASEKTFDRYTLDPALTQLRLTAPASIVEVASRQFVYFSYLNYAGDVRDQEFVASLFDVREQEITSSMFYGRSMLSSPSDSEYRIEGQSPEALSGGITTQEQFFLFDALSKNSCLVPISRGDALTDDAIAWWLSKNPAAEKNATRIVFGTLDPDSSLIEGFKKVNAKKYKDSSNNYTAAMFDMRGYTVIVAYSKAKKDYVLAWCEPVCKDKNKDKFLNTIYFDNDNSISMFYYKGKTTFKYHLNIATKSISR